MQNICRIVFSTSFSFDPFFQEEKIRIIFIVFVLGSVETFENLKKS
jgi:hypothetical protein